MELREYLRVVRQYLWLLLMLPVVGAGGAYYYSLQQPTVYEATTTLEITRGQDPTQDPYGILTARNASNAAGILSAKLQSQTFLQKVQERLGLTQGIGGMIKAEQVGDTQFLRVTARSNDRALSQALADTAATVFAEEQISQQQARFQERLVELETQAATLEASIAETELAIASLASTEGELSELQRLERARLESQLNRDQTRLVVLLNSAEEFRMTMTRYADYISIYTPAELATSAAGTNAIQNTLMGGAGGLVIGVSLAFLLEYFDDAIRSPEEIKRVLSLDVIGTLPHVRGTNGRVEVAVLAHPLEPISEAFRNLRTSFLYATLDHPSMKLLITSPLPTEGKSFTSANLAATLAQGGKSVILLDTDLRHPTVDQFFDMPREPGVTTALLSPRDRERVLQETAVKGLRVVTAGESVRNPAELLSSRTFHEYVEWLATQADIVILDCPPVLPVADAAMLASMVDKVLLILDHGDSTRSAASQALERLHSAGADILGAVLNRLNVKSNGYYYHYYYPRSESDKGIRRRLASLFRRRSLGRREHRSLGGER